MPPVEFDWAPTADVGLGIDVEKAAKPRTPTPIRESLRIASRSIGKTSTCKSATAAPSFTPPLYPTLFQGGIQGANKLPFDPYIMQSNKETWNEDRPFPSRQYRPKPPKENEQRGTLDRKGVGPFPLGVAVETDVPADWFESKEAKPTKVRVVALGHGGLFAGNEVAPAKEKLLLDSCNWLLGRDDLLARENDQGPDKGTWKTPG